MQNANIFALFLKFDINALRFFKKMLYICTPEILKVD